MEIRITSTFGAMLSPLRRGLRIGPVATRRDVTLPQPHRDRSLL
jgi:hypothetical protein